MAEVSNVDYNLKTGVLRNFGAVTERVSHVLEDIITDLIETGGLTWEERKEIKSYPSVTRQTTKLIETVIDNNRLQHFMDALQKVDRALSAKIFSDAKRTENVSDIDKLSLPQTEDEVIYTRQNQPEDLQAELESLRLQHERFNEKFDNIQSKMEETMNRGFDRLATSLQEGLKQATDASVQKLEESMSRMRADICEFTDAFNRFTEELAPNTGSLTGEKKLELSKKYQEIERKYEEIVAENKRLIDREEQLKQQLNDLEKKKNALLLEKRALEMNCEMNQEKLRKLSEQIETVNLKNAELKKAQWFEGERNFPFKKRIFKNSR